MLEHLPPKAGIPIISSSSLRVGSKSMTPEQVKNAHELLLSCLVSFAKIPPGAGRAKVIHRRVDEYVQKSLRGRRDEISCSRGCSHCCRIYVSTTSDEADLLLSYADKHKIPLDLGRIREQAPWQELDYMERTVEESRCVFLDESGDCRVYEVRPSSCRAYQVITPKEHCDLTTNRMTEKPVRAIFSVFVEVIVSAALTVEFCKIKDGKIRAIDCNDKNMSLPSQLLAKLAPVEKTTE